MIGRAAAAALIALGLFLCVAEDASLPLVTRDRVHSHDARSAAAPVTRAGPTGDVFFDRLIEQAKGGGHAVLRAPSATARAERTSKASR